MEAGDKIRLAVHNTLIRKRKRRRPDTPAKQARWKPRVVWGCIAAGALVLIWAAVARTVAPVSNTSADHFDAIIVLGSPADSDGNPTPEQLARVTEGVREYQRGVAPHLILTGGSTLHGFVEARVMARTARAQGIPDSAIFIEPTAKDTIQNACYSARIMKANGWHSAEVVSTGWHLPRAGIILSALPIEWRTHAAPPISPQSSAYLDTMAAVEVLKTARYLVWARWIDHCQP